MTRHSQRPQRDNTDLDAFFAEADDIIEHWHGGLDSNEWHADGSHQTSIHGDYYGQDYPESDDVGPDDFATDYVSRAIVDSVVRQVHRVGIDDQANFPPSYVPMVMQMWLADVWFAGWLGVIRQEQADNIRNGFPSCSSLRHLNTLLNYVARYDHEGLVNRADRMWTDAMWRVGTYGANARAVIFTSGNTYTVGGPLPWPDWEEVLLPVPADHGEAYVKQVYLHSWLMLRSQLPMPTPVVGMVEGLVRQIIEAQFTGHRLTAGLHGAEFNSHRDEAEATTQFVLRAPARNPDGNLVWITAKAAIPDEVANHARRSDRIEQYDLPLMRSDMDRMDPFPGAYHDLTTALEALRRANNPPPTGGTDE